MKQFKIYLRYTLNSFQTVLASRASMAIFLTGKTLRIGLFLVFLHFLFQGASSLAGYSRAQIIFFYLSFNLIDTLAQLFFREVYRFRPLVISGGLDYILLRPIHPLIRVLLGGADVLDLVMLVLLATITVWFGLTQLHPSPLNWLVYFTLIFNGLLIAAAIHIAVLALGVITTSIDHLIMLHRDFAAMLRIPVDLYTEPLRSLLTFALPLGIMLTFPPQALMGLLSPTLILTSFLFTIFSLFLSFKFWNYSLRHYQSASS